MDTHDTHRVIAHTSTEASAVALVEWLGQAGLDDAYASHHPATGWRATARTGNGDLAWAAAQAMLSSRGVTGTSAVREDQPDTGPSTPDH
ncbi:hypothetical protein O4J56_06775 [Nocardiopsis sp. RSe5-2]|uniref:DUF2007 domain-containing protein n=1 Tax=Nocardiopsis endophytica TaxID=3018445 RepID=A0ABT4U064_9ACTN|nr:hypothetical protein [Nocardiopsis endophytica]MDA2810338.1 hypothetical protein [Nocardiopsis endophytica]